jgi:hypothetical protein
VQLFETFLEQTPRGEHRFLPHLASTWAEHRPLHRYVFHLQEQGAAISKWLTIGINSNGGHVTNPTGKYFMFLIGLFDVRSVYVTIAFLRDTVAVHMPRFITASEV